MAAKKKKDPRVVVRQRALANKVINHLSTVEFIKAMKLEKRLERILAKLEDEKIESVDVARLRLEADICHRLLQKITPDVKQVDVNANVTQNVNITQKHEVDGLLLEAGLDPEQIWPTIQ